MDTKILLGKRLREIRKRKNLKQEQLAELINVEPASISNIENGRNFPSLQTLENIIKTYNQFDQSEITYNELLSSLIKHINEYYELIQLDKNNINKKIPIKLPLCFFTLDNNTIFIVFLLSHHLDLVFLHFYIYYPLSRLQRNYNCAFVKVQVLFCNYSISAFLHNVNQKYVICTIFFP